MADNVPLVVFSHLRWDFVYQRPQHLLSRFATKRRVIVIEEPIHNPHSAHWERFEPQPNVLVLRPHTAVPEGGFNDAQIAVLAPMVDQLLADEGVDSCVAWLYTPMALPLAQHINPTLLIYDCMDELSAFAFAPRQLLEREQQTLHVADLVWTGGPSLYRAKKDRSPNVHCFPSSVDAAHFKQTLAEPADQVQLAQPRFGFYGVIDERIDLAILATLAEAHPEWEIVLVGPVVKIDPAHLPHAANLHYVGQRSYSELPAYLGGWDVCLLPFARNEATRFISPTKTLEYMAAEKPIVSTPITDVAEPYGEIVYLGDNTAEFVQACEQALNATSAEREQRTSAMREVLALTSWDRTAAAMDDLIEHAIAQQFATA